MQTLPFSKTAMDINHPRVQGWHYWLPFAVFMGFIMGNQYLKLPYPMMYVGRTIVVAGLLIWLWKYFTKVRWNHWQLGIVVGVVGTVQWIGMELCLQWARVQFPKESLWHNVIGLTSMVKADAEDIYVIPERVTAETLWWFLAIRWMGSTLVVPVMEELFWRDWLWRTAASPNDFKLHGVGEYDKYSFWLIPVFFAFVHVQWLTAIVWALMIGWLLWKTKSIGACIIAHAVTNFLLGAWIILCWQMQWRPMGFSQWFFW
jgi:uncharacterized protein